MTDANRQSSIVNRQSDPTGPEVAEALRVAGYVIEKMRAAVPTERRHVDKVIGPFAKPHEEMVRALCTALEPHIGALSWEIADHYTAPQSSRVLVVAWKRRNVETMKRQNIKTAKRG